MEGTLQQIDGSLIHVCLAYHYARKIHERGERAPEWFYTAPIEDVLKSTSRGHPERIQLAKDCYMAYFARYRAEPLWPIAVEEEFSARVGEIDPGGPNPELDELTVTCKPDLLVEERGEIIYDDHKSTEADRRAQRLPIWHDDGEYALSNQIFQNLHILRIHFGRQQRIVRGARINRVRRVRPYDFDRNDVIIGSLAYAQAARGIRNKARRRAEAKRRLIDLGFMLPGSNVPLDDRWREQIIQALATRDIDANYDACSGRFGDCELRALCLAGDVARQRLLLDKIFTWPGKPSGGGPLIPWSPR